MAFPVFHDLPPSPAAGTPAPSGGEPRRAPTPAWTRLEWATLLAIVLLFAARNVPWRLSDYDQAKQAFTSLEMAQGGRWAFQHLPGSERPATKPPLVGWLAAGLRVFPCLGNWELAWRLPSALAAAALVVLLWRAGRLAWPAGGAALAAGAFGFNSLAPRLATLVRTDMPLTLWITALGLLIWRRARDPAPGPWTPRERWTVFALVTAAMLTKGPVAYAFLAPSLLTVTLWERRRRASPPALHPSSLLLHSFPLWPWLAPLAVFALWLAAGCWTQPGFYENVVGREFLGRFDGSEHAVHRPQPVWFYALHLLARWAPWSVLLILLAVATRGAWRTALREDAGARWLLCWVVGGLVLMSLVPSKRVDRIFPVIPPLCLLLATVAGRVGRREKGIGSNLPCLALRWVLPVALVMTIATTAYEVRKARAQHEDALDRFGRRVRALADARGWHPVELVVVSTNSPENDETLLVCLRRLSPLSPAEAVAAWRTGRVDALALDVRVLAEMREQLGPFSTEVVSDSPRQNQSPYVLVRRTAAATAKAR